MIKHSLRAMALVFAMGVCLITGILIGRSGITNDMFVSFPPDSPTVATRSTEPAIVVDLININTASAETLAKLPGIGETLANNIIAYRTAHGRFVRIIDLKNVEGIGDTRYESIKDKITVGG